MNANWISCVERLPPYLNARFDTVPRFLFYYFSISNFYRLKPYFDIITIFFLFPFFFSDNTAVELLNEAIENDLAIGGLEHHLICTCGVNPEFQFCQKQLGQLASLKYHVAATVHNHNSTWEDCCEYLRFSLIFIRLIVSISVCQLCRLNFWKRIWIRRGVNSKTTLALYGKLNNLWTLQNGIFKILKSNFPRVQFHDGFKYVFKKFYPIHLEKIVYDCYVYTFLFMCKHMSS